MKKPIPERLTREQREAYDLYNEAALRRRYANKSRRAVVPEVNRLIVDENLALSKENDALKDRVKELQAEIINLARIRI